MAPTLKAQATAARISEAAAELFLENGFDETTVAQIGAASGVATGTVLLHFGTKSQVAAAAFSVKITAAVAEAVELMPEGSAPFQVSHIVEHLYNWYDDHRSVAPTLLRESLFATGQPAREYTDAVRHTIGAFTRICAAHQAEGDLKPDADPALMGEGILADYLLVLLQGLRGQFQSVGDQLDHFNRLSELRWATALAAIPPSPESC